MLVFFKRHTRFLRVVCLYTVSAFGGPQGHLALMQKWFVEREKLLSTTELLDLNLFVQILPGPSSTQLLGLIAHKRGGSWLSLLAMLIWIFPATFLMLLLALFYSHLQGLDARFSGSFSYLGIMALAFLFAYCWQLWQSLAMDKFALLVVALTGILTFVFFHSPWLFPLVIVASGIASYFRNLREYSPPKTGKVKLYWKHLLVFLGLFIICGVLSETARISEWKNRKIFNIAENNYRFGSLVFGGGQVLIPMLCEKYASAPKTKYLEKKDILNGAGLLQIVPGPVFSITTFVATLVFAREGYGWQIFGGLLATMMIFLPGYFLAIFFYPLWQKFRENNIIFRAMLGLKSALLGLLCGSLLYLAWEHPLLQHYDHRTLLAVLVLVLTVYLTRYTKIAPPLIVLAVILLSLLDFYII